MGSKIFVASYCYTQSPRYALVTWNEATENLGIDPDHLSHLASVQACGVTLFLRSQGWLVRR